MLGDNGNHGENGGEERVGEPTQEGPVEAKVPEEKLEPVQRPNQAVIKEGVMTVTLYLEEASNAFAAAVGSLDLAKDMVKGYYGQKALAEAAIKARATMGIIRPKVS